MIQHLAILSLPSPCEGLRLSKLNSADHRKIHKIAHKGICFARLRQIQLQQLLQAESIVLKSLLAVVLYFTASEKENLRTESYFL